MNRHSLDSVSLVFGIVFAGLGLLFLTGGVNVVDLVAQFWPLALVVLGLAILVGSRRPKAPTAPRPGQQTAPPAQSAPGEDS